MESRHQRSLPALTITPTRHHHCCLALSTVLIDRLYDVVVDARAAGSKSDEDVKTSISINEEHASPSQRANTNQQKAARDASVRRDQPRRRTVVLSVGSGSGVVERLLLERLGGRNLDEDGDVQVYGVEIPATAKGAEMNAYLPRERRVVVGGSWDVFGVNDLLALPALGRKSEDEDEEDEDEEEEEEDCDLAPNGSSRSGGAAVSENVDVVLMFVYPRQPCLVSRYIDAYTSLPGTEPIGADSEGGGKADISLKAVIWAGPRADWEEYEGLFTSLGQNGCDGEEWRVDVGRGEEMGVDQGEGIVIARRVG